MEPRQRKKNRLQGYDYGQPGYYFITICANKRAELFWDMAAENASVGAACGRPPLSAIGLCVQEEIRPFVSGRPQAAPTIERAINQFKGAATKKAGFPIWQKGYHDHIIRNEANYQRIWEYIDTNPAKWREDCYYCERGDFSGPSGRQ